MRRQASAGLFQFNAERDDGQGDILALLLLLCAVHLLSRYSLIEWITAGCKAYSNKRARPPQAVTNSMGRIFATILDCRRLIRQPERLPLIHLQMFSRTILDYRMSFRTRRQRFPSDIVPCFSLRTGGYFQPRIDTHHFTGTLAFFMRLVDARLLPGSKTYPFPPRNNQKHRHFSCPMAKPA